MQHHIRTNLKTRYPVPPPGDCPICGVHTQNWVLDHCHNEESFRGYICKSCNSGVGLLHDDPVILSKALLYLLNSTKPSDNASNRC